MEDELAKIIDACIQDLITGVPTTEIADKYCECATPELRNKLIAGLEELKHLYREKSSLIKSLTND